LERRDILLVIANSMTAMASAMWPLGFALVASGGLSLLALRKIKALQKRELAAQLRVSELEFRLNEDEAARQAEAHILLTWRDRSVMPDRVSGNMHGNVKMPEDGAAIMEFKSWLEVDSAAMLQEGLSTLQETGRAFNFGIKTLQGELLEADGRAAGAMAALRFRPVSGDRRQISELTYDARKLAKQVERLSALLDAAPFPVWISDATGTLQWVNQAYLKASDVANIEALLKSGFTLIKPQDIDAAKANPAQSLLGRAHAIQHGSRRSFNIHEIAIDQGRASFAIDVTELEVNEKELDRHIKAHASTLNQLTSALAIFGPDQKLTYFNSAYANLWGLETGWLGSGPSDGEILDKLRSERLLPEQVNYREWKTKHLAAYTSLETTENFWYLPDGRSVRVIAERHPFGGVTYLYDNLTREVQLESRYNELFDTQQETLDNLAEAVALFASDGTIRLYNPAFQKFWELDPVFLEKRPTLAEISAHTNLGADAKLAWAEMRYAISAIDAERKPIEGQVQQDERVLRYRSVPLPDGNSLVTFTDFSDAARAEQALRDRAEALEAADRLKNSFMANVSYEIRTPLTSIVGFAETLAYGLGGALTEKQAEYVQNIRKSSEDLKQIIDSIIDLSAIDAGTMELKTEDIDLADLLQTSAEKFSPLLAKRSLSIEIEMGPDLDRLMCDPQRLDQILGHLLSNAAGFSPPGSTVKMGARRLGDDVQIWVADTGRGIEPEFQGKAFERFQAKPLAGSHRGPGLGLAIVKAFTELHGGRVALVSKINQGTTVVCTVPIAGPHKQSEQRRGQKDRRAA
jgi:signal transduction histidine kinase